MRQLRSGFRVPLVSLSPSPQCSSAHKLMCNGFWQLGGAVGVGGLPWCWWPANYQEPLQMNQFLIHCLLSLPYATPNSFCCASGGRTSSIPVCLRVSVSAHGSMQNCIQQMRPHYWQQVGSVGQRQCSQQSGPPVWLAGYCLLQPDLV